MDKRLISYAAQLFHVEAESITNPSRRDRGIVAVRYALVWALLRARPRWTRQEVAEAIGLRDRKSVYAGDQRADDMRKTDRDYQSKLDRLLLVAGRSEELPPPPPQPALRIPAQPDRLAIWTVKQRGGIFVRTA